MEPSNAPYFTQEIAHDDDGTTTISVTEHRRGQGSVTVDLRLTVHEVQIEDGRIRITKARVWGFDLAADLGS